MIKKLLFATLLTLGLSVCIYQPTYADEANVPMPISDGVIDEEAPENIDVTNTGTVGGGNNGSSDQNFSDETAEPDTTEEEETTLDLGNWPVILSISAIVIAMLLIVILNIRHRS